MNFAKFLLTSNIALSYSWFSNLMTVMGVHPSQILFYLSWKNFFLIGSFCCGAVGQGSDIATVVDIGHSFSSDSVPGLGTSICWECGWGKKKSSLIASYSFYYYFCFTMCSSQRLLQISTMKAEVYLSVLSNCIL